MRDTRLAVHPVHTNPVHAGPGRSPDADARLQASRRLDWRFLLPDPALGRVAYVGAAQPALIEALQLLAAQVDLWTAASSGAENALPGSPDAYGLVVAHAPAAGAFEATLRQAAALLRPGGTLYLETRGRLTRRLAALRRVGLANVAAYWIWPNFAACTKIIPVDHLATVAQFEGARLNRWGVGRLLPRLARSRLAHDLIPCLGIVAQRPSGNDSLDPGLDRSLNGGLR